jgi:hypothetical protein
LLLLPSHLSFLTPFVKFPPAESLLTISKSVKTTTIITVREVVDSTIVARTTVTWMLPQLMLHLLMLLLPAANSLMILRFVKNMNTVITTVREVTVTATPVWTLPPLMPRLLMLPLLVVNSWMTSKFGPVI